MAFCPCPVTAAMALNIWEVMFCGKALTARVRSAETEGGRRLEDPSLFLRAREGGGATGASAETHLRG